jgi:hypothetical protein
MSLAPAVGKIGDHFARSLEHAVRRHQPIEHWAIEDALPAATCKALAAALPATRLFFSPENRARFPVADDIASAFQCRATVRQIEEFCGVELRGASLRIEQRLRGDEPSGALFAMRVDLSEVHAGAAIIVADAASRHAPTLLGATGRSLVIGYVAPDWPARDELAFPMRPVG